MSVTNLPVGGYKQISATGNVCPLPTNLVGIFVSAASATPTITIYDDASTGTTTKVVDVFTPAAATYYPIPAGLSKGLYVVISGTVSATFIFA